MIIIVVRCITEVKIKNKNYGYKKKLIESIKSMPDKKFNSLDSILEEIILIDKN